MKSVARVVVIGGGVMGVSLLYHLTKLGWTDVMLLEKAELTAGSTWHAAGLCTHFAHNVTIMNMRAHSVRLYKELLPAETGQPVGFHACGALRVTRNPDRIDEFRQVQGLGRFAGYEFRIVTPDELKDLHPLAETGDGLIGAIYEPFDGHVDPSQATQAMAARARAAGATILRHNPVEAIERDPGGGWRVHARDGSCRAAHIVNAAGTWCREIGDLMGLDLPVVPMLHQYLVTDRIEAVAALDRELPIIRDPEESWYVRQERDGLILGPYEKAAQPWAVDGVPKDFGADLLPPDLDRVEAIVERAMARVPALAEGGIKTVVNGPITFTPDANPLIGPAFGLEGAWLLTGSSMGVMEGGGAGKLLAEWIVAGEPPMDALAVDPRRFGGYADRDYRLTKAVECFGLQFGVHYPYEERPAARPKRSTPAYERQRAAGAVFGAAYGWERPNWYAAAASGHETLDSYRRTNWFGAVAAECRAVSARAGLADLSAFAKFEVAGPGAEAFLDGLGANRPPRGIGRIALIHALTPSGGVASELTVTRLADDRYYLVSAAAAERHDADLLRQRSAGFDLRVETVTAERGVLALAGPSAREILAGLTDADLQAFPWLTGREIEVAGIAVRALRVSYVGELGWELHAPMARLGELWDALVEAGKPHGLGLFGAFAMNALRLEKGYRAWGLDLTTERTPLEAGLGALARTDGRDFVGREALLRRAEAPGRWRMALLELNGAGPDPFYGHPVLRGDVPLGLVTSGAFGHRTGKALALAYLTDGAAPDDTDLRVEILGETRPAAVLARPPYDPGSERMKI